MANDIAPLTPITPTPLVRQKRHYPGEERQQPQQRQRRSDTDSSADHTDEELEEKTINKKSVDIDEKDVTVRHIDEYA